MQHQQRLREKAREELGEYRPDWLMPVEGSGYREELIPWEEGEGAMVVRERQAEPSYVERLTGEAARVTHEAEQRKELKKANEEARKAKRLAYDLLEDESKWRGL